MKGIQNQKSIFSSCFQRRIIQFLFHIFSVINPNTKLYSRYIIFMFKENNDLNELIILLYILSCGSL